MPHQDVEMRRVYEREYMRRYRLRRPDVGIKARRKYYKKNGQRWREYAATFRRENPELQRERGRKSYRKHIEKNRERTRRWRIEHPEKAAAQWSQRRARKKGARCGTDRVAYAAFVQHVRTVPIIKCYWCRRNVKATHRHIDHIVALTKGGADDVHNLCCSCADCNMQKRDKSPEQFTGQHHLDFSIQIEPEKRH